LYTIFYYSMHAVVFTTACFNMGWLATPFVF
jgi:hypothetical protein